MRKKLNTKHLAIMALMVAISIILARWLVFYITPASRINLGNIPVMLAGLLLGPVAGLLTGVVSDLLGAFMSGYGLLPPITIGAALFGLIPALLKKPLLGKTVSLWRVGIVIFVTDIVASLLWNTPWLAMWQGVDYWVMLVSKIPVVLGLAVAETLVIYYLYKPLNRALKR
ncbi:MAG: folate family ECF transporter S component [Clostridiales bacterium]|nr:folate family ECF transporter S component [Clostridiales bacterium]